MKGRMTLSIVFLLAAAGVFSAGCYYGPPHRHVFVGPPGPAVVFHYWYYPDVRVYYDYEHEVYFYLSSGTWVSVRTLPPAIVLSKDRYVILELDTDKPYRYHERHRLQHPPGAPIKRVAPAPRPQPGKVEKVKEGPEPKPKKEPKPKPKPEPRGKGKGRAGGR